MIPHPLWSPEGERPGKRAQRPEGGAGWVTELKKENPKSVDCCVLLNKVHDRKVDDFKVDFVGLDVDDRYVYGCGMDFHGYLRHLPGIYAIKEDKLP